MSPYAKDTGVPVASSKAAIEHMLSQRGCSSFQSGWDQETQSAHVVFMMGATRIGLVLPFPKADTFRFNAQGRERSKEHAENAWRQEERRRWRALLLVIKAKLEAIESGISTLEREFLADVVLPDGRSLGEVLVPQIAALQGGHLQLPSPKDKELRRVDGTTAKGRS